MKQPHNHRNRTPHTATQKSPRYKHDLGQHFLYDKALLRSLVEAAGVTKDDCVLEIGPGEGTLTACLCQAAQRVVAVEVDDAVIPRLLAALQGVPNVELIRGNILKQDTPAFWQALGNGFMVVANIPYNITTPILELFLNGRLPIKQLSVMVQKEVAQKLVATPGQPGYGMLSLRARFYGDPVIVAEIPASAFVPPPKVDSAFVNLPFRGAPPAPLKNEALFWQLTKACFAKRRKTLLNGLKSLPCALNLEAEIKASLESLGFPPSVRGETLGIDSWIALTNALDAFVSPLFSG